MTRIGVAIGVGLIRVYRIVFAFAAVVAAGSNPPARATPSRPSCSTACCAGAGWVPSGSPAAIPGTPAATTRSPEDREPRPRDPPPAPFLPGSRRSRCWLVGLALLLAACVPGVGRPGRPGGPTPVPSQAPLTPAAPGAEPDRASSPGCSRRSSRRCSSCSSFLDVRSSEATSSIAIILLTIILRLLAHPALPAPAHLARARCSSSSPRSRSSSASTRATASSSRRPSQEFYRQRGINPAGGCLPILLQFGLLIPMYSVISQGLTNYDPSAMWHVFGINLFPGITCPPAPIFSPTPGTS